MKYVAITLLLVAACVSDKNGKEPKGSAKTRPHPEFEQFRPNTVAVLRVDAPVAEMRQKLRRGIYDGLFEKKYACLKLATVDAHSATTGKFDGKNLDWDATFKVTIDSWKPILGGRYYAATGSARMTHKGGELLWERIFKEYPFEVQPMSGKTDFTQAYIELNKLILRELPERPPIARE
ncbi:MAG: hypothetical protein ACYTGV_17230 [Planctomycetota bacterium]|jgi:hypothetical protein